MDRFSALPHEVAHHILSSLPITDSTRVGILSKSCRGFHLSNPTLNFTEFPPELMRTSNGRSQILSSLDGFFNVQRAFNKIQSFCVNWVSRFDIRETRLGEIKRVSSVEISQILGWVQTAVLRCNVEMLNISVRVNVSPLRPGEENMVGLKGMIQVEFPSCVFVSGSSLRSLTLGVMDVVLKSNCFHSSSNCNLVSLKLGNVTIEDEDGFCKWVSLSCKSLEELSLWGVQGLENFTIKSSSLKFFQICPRSGNLHLNISGEKLETVCIDYHWGFSKSSNTLNVCAPNLKHLTWFGNIMNYCSLGELNCLEEVEIGLTTRYVERPQRYSDLYTKLSEFFSSIRRVKVLNIQQHCAQELTERGFMHYLESLNNVQYLGVHINTDIDDKMIPSIVSLLRAVPNFTAFSIRSPDDDDRLFVSHETTLSSFYSGHWQLQKLDFINRIKEVTIEITDGSNGIEFAKYVLENSTRLKKVIFICAPRKISSLLEELRVEVSFRIRGKGQPTGDLQSKLDEFFSSMRRVKVLVLAQHTAQDLKGEGLMHLLESLYNVQHLGIRIRLLMIPSLVFQFS